MLGGTRRSSQEPRYSHFLPSGPFASVGGASFPEEFWVYYYMEQALPLLDPTSKDEWIGVQWDKATLELGERSPGWS